MSSSASSATTVRDNKEGRAVATLEYQAYASMACNEMARIAAGIERAGIRVAALHRTGLLRVGDVAVVCAASAPHRDEAFRACRLLINRIKADVPIGQARARFRGHGGWDGWMRGATATVPLNLRPPAG